MESEHARVLEARGFRIERELGRGGMGVVYLATQLSLSRRVAIKVINAEHAEVSDLKRFRTEARSMKGVQHPNIVRIFDLELIEDPPYLVLEYVEGARPLDGLLEAREVPAELGPRIARGVLEGLAAVHEHAIVHRDLKPANVLLDASWVPRIIDFGLARSLSADETRATRDGQIVGTLAYMPPEQLMGEETGLAADVYAWALMAVEVLAGRPIFSPVALPADRFGYVERLNKPVPSARRWLPALDPTLVRLLDRCLSQTPSSRPASAIAALEQWPSELGGVQSRPGELGEVVEASGLANAGAPPPADAGSAKELRTSVLEGPAPAPPKPAERKRATSGRTSVLNPPAPAVAASTPVAGSSGSPSGTSVRMRTRLAVGIFLATGAFAIAYRSRSVPVTEPGGSPSTAWRELAGSPDGARPSAHSTADLAAEPERMLLRVTSDAPVGATLTWTTANTTGTRVVAAAPSLAIDLSAPDLAAAETLEVRLEPGTSVDLTTLARPYVAALGDALARVPAERLCERVSALRYRDSERAGIITRTAPPSSDTIVEAAAAARRAIAPSLLAQMRRLAPLARHWFHATPDAALRRTFLARVQNGELVAEMLARAGVTDAFPVAGLLPAAYRVRRFEAGEKTGPAMSMHSLRFLPVPLSLWNGKPPARTEKPVIAVEGAFVPLHTDVVAEPRRHDVTRELLDPSRAKQVFQDQSWTLEVDLPAEALHRAEVVDVGLNGGSSGDGVIWVDVNDSGAQPYFLRNPDKPHAKEVPNREWWRRFPGTALRPGRNTVKFSARPFPGQKRLDLMWVWFMYLVPRAAAP